jgi:AcrR family transcriptional regulator
MGSAERRRQILDEAIRVVGRRGYYGFSVKEVADRCGLTVAGLLHHVGTKDGLLIALLQDRDRRDLEAVAGYAELDDAERFGEGMSMEQVVRFLHDLVVRNSTQPELVRLYTMLRTESLYEEHPAYEYFRARDEQVLQTFARMVTGKLDEPLSTARQLLAVMGGMEEQWLRSTDTFDLATEWDRAAAKILRLT